MNFSKKQGQKLMPEYLLSYTTELEKAHPNPNASWGGGGGGETYTAGDGIDISEENVISIDNTVALKSDIPSVSDFITEDEVDTKLEDYELKSDAFSGDYNDLENKPSIPTNTSDLTNDSGFITNSALSGYATETWVENKGYITGITSSDVTNALGYTPGTSNFSGSYNDLTNKPTIPTKTSDLNNDSGFIDKSVNDLTNYTLTSSLSTVATSGDYDDLLNKPTIPTVSYPVTDVEVNGTSVLNGTVAEITIPDTTYMVTTNTSQQITGQKTFSSGIVETYNKNTSQINTFGTRMYADEINILDAFSNLDVHLLYPQKSNGTYTLATTDDIPTTASSTSTSTSTFTPTTETLTFTYSDNTTATITIVTSATVSTTTTTTTTLS